MHLPISKIVDIETIDYVGAIRDVIKSHFKFSSTERIFVIKLLSAVSCPP